MEPLGANVVGFVPLCGRAEGNLHQATRVSNPGQAEIPFMGRLYGAKRSVNYIDRMSREKEGESNADAEFPDEVKEKSRGESLVRGVGLVTNSPVGANPRDGVQVSTKGVFCQERG